MLCCNAKEYLQQEVICVTNRCLKLSKVNSLTRLGKNIHEDLGKMEENMTKQNLCYVSYCWFKIIVFTETMFSYSLSPIRVKNFARNLAAEL